MEGVMPITDHNIPCPLEAIKELIIVYAAAVRRPIVTTLNTSFSYVGAHRENTRVHPILHLPLKSYGSGPSS